MYLLSIEEMLIVESHVLRMELVRHRWMQRIWRLRVHVMVQRHGAESKNVNPLVLSCPRGSCTCLGLRFGAGIKGGADPASLDILECGSSHGVNGVLPPIDTDRHDGSSSLISILECRSSDASRLEFSAFLERGHVPTHDYGLATAGEARFRPDANGLASRIRTLHVLEMGCPRTIRPRDAHSGAASILMSRR